VEPSKNEAMYHHRSAPPSHTEIRKTDFGSDHARKFFAERQMNTRLCARLKLLGILMALLVPALVAVSEEQSGSKEKWAAPAAEARKKNPVAVNESSLAAGQKIYLKRCLACHGKTGNGDGPDAVDLGIHPAKLSDAAVREETDGELFWKITVGKKPMPNYGSRLSPADRWNVINYLRTLAKR
jgi:mono/diheme cytochrome c family protein